MELVLRCCVYWPNRLGWRQKVLQPPITFMILSWWCPLGHGKWHLPAIQFILAVRLIPILTHLSSRWTIPLKSAFSLLYSTSSAFNTSLFLTLTNYKIIIALQPMRKSDTNIEPTGTLVTSDLASWSGQPDWQAATQVYILATCLGEGGRESPLADERVSLYCTVRIFLYAD